MNEVIVILLVNIYVKQIHQKVRGILKHNLLVCLRMKYKYLMWLIRVLLSLRSTEVSVGELHTNAVCDLFIPLTSATTVSLEVLIHLGQGNNKYTQNYYWSWNCKRLCNKYIPIKSLSRAQTLLKRLMVVFHGCISYYVLNHIVIVTLFI